MLLNRIKIFKPARYQFILFIWVIAVYFGFSNLLIYSITPGESAPESLPWPADSKLERASDQATLVAFLHPKCPCSAATVGEIERLMTALRGRAKVLAVLFWPKNKPVQWVKARLWERLVDIPGIIPTLDRDGEEAKNFHAKTSGQILLYDPKGKLVFAGGITPARGHSGDSSGREAILNYMSTGSVIKKNSPVFGCSLRNPERAVQSTSP